MQKSPIIISRSLFTQSKGWILPLGLLLLLGSCSGDSTRDEQFCECMEAGDELNKFSAELLERQPTAKDAEKMKKLREKSKEECSDYYTMSGDEMRKRKAQCKKN